MESIPISSPPMVSRAMKDLLKSRHNITMKAVSSAGSHPRLNTHILKIQTKIPSSFTPSVY